jgi:peptidoglycan/LPS O-acetylase OafA/YrhL
LIKSFNIKDEIAPLTSFRFLVALVIFLSHIGLFFDLKLNFWILDEFIANCSVFMTGFFVLSGYILSQIYSDRDFTIKQEVADFYIKRFARIYPVYLSATLFFFFILPQFNFTFTDWLRVLVNDLFLTQAFFPNVSDLGINCITWSISVEAFFYFCFPLLIVLFKNRPRTLLCLALLISFIVSINIIGDVHTNIDSVRRLALYYTNPLFRLSEFMVGISFNLLQKENYLVSIPKVLQSKLFIFSIIFILTILPLSGEMYSHMGSNFLILPLFGLFVYNFHKTKTGVFCNNRYLNLMGKVSYSFYLWQFIILIFGMYLMKTTSYSVLFLVIISFVANTFVSLLSYYYIEEPFRRFIVKLSKNDFFLYPKFVQKS